MRRANNLTTFMCRLSLNMGASACWNPQGLPMPVMGLLYLYWSRFQLKCDGTRWRTGGEVKGKLANGVGSQYPSHYLRNMVFPALLLLMRTSRLPVVDSTDAPPPGRFKWTRPFRRKTKSGFCACAITFKTQYTAAWSGGGLAQYILNLGCRWISFTIRQS